MASEMRPGARLQLLLQREFLVIPGVYNGISARLASDRGFKALYLSGAALSASQGLPDIGIISFNSFLQTVKEITTVSKLPLLVDADTGFGDCGEAAAAIAAAGAAAIQIEDQIETKRCGHLEGKQLISCCEMQQKIKSIKENKSESLKDFLICARTDAFAVEGFDGALARAKAYVEAGAHIIFPEGLPDEETFAAFGAALRGKYPGVFLLANMTEFGKTKIIKMNKIKSISFNCAIFPVSALRVALKAMDDMFEELQSQGTLENQISKMYTRQELYKTLRYDPTREWSLAASVSGGDEEKENK